MRRKLLRAPLVGLAAALAAGVLLGRYLPLPVGAWLVAGAVAMLLAAAGIVRPHLRGVLLFTVPLAVLCLGAVRIQMTYNSLPPGDIATFSGPGQILSTIRGRVSSYPQIVHPQVEFGYRPQPKMTFVLAAEQIRTDPGWADVQGPVRVRLDEPYRRYRPGQRVELVGLLGRYADARNPGQFDAAEYARLHGGRVWFRVPAEDGVIPLEDGRENLLSRIVWKFRALLRQRMAEAGDVESGRLLSALLLGERDPALADLNDAMRRAGVAHFLSISGLHLGIFLGFLYLLCRVAMLSPRRSAAVVLAALVLYLLMAEPRPPLLRSAIMAAAVATGVLLGRRGSTLNALALAGIVLLLIDPRQLLQPGFQLSFLIVSALLLFTNPMRRLLFRRVYERRGLVVYRQNHPTRRWLMRRLADGLMTAVAMSVTAYLAAAPLVAVHFGLFSPYAIVLSLVLLPLVTAVLVPGYLAMAVVLWLPNLSAALASLAAFFAGLVAWVVRLAENLPALSLSLFPLGWAWALLCYAALLALLLYRRIPRGRTVAAVLLVLLIGVTAWSQRPVSPPEGCARLNLLAVGAGQCAVLETPAGQTWLLDAGSQGGYDIFARVLEPFLLHRRLRTPAGAIVSHANSDHYNALAGVLEHWRLKEVYLGEDFPPPEAPPGDGSRRIVERIEDADIPIVRLVAGNRFELDGVGVEVLWPPAGSRQPTVNDTSLVLRLACGERSVLLTGDIGEAAQAALLEQPEDLRADVLVLPHHGGWEQTLPDFVQAVNPQIVLVSGSRDPCGPASADKEVKEFYRRLKTRGRYFCTARDGWVGLTFGTRGLEANTMRER